MFKRIINWLLYDKPLCNNDVKEWDNRIWKKDWKKNWLGLIKIYDSYNIKYDWCFIRVESHLQEDDLIDDYRNVLTIGFGPRYRKWLLPFSIIKPVLDYHHYKRDKDCKTKEISWSKYEEREYGICIVKEEGYIQLTWDYCSNLMNNITGHKSKSIWLWFFWKQCNRTKQELLNLDGSLYKDITDIKDSDTSDRYDIIKAYEKAQPYYLFEILDYDKEKIQVVARLERNTYSYGNGKFTRWLMKFFKKPIIRTYLELEFLKEIGSRKGSWKGGTTGHAVEVLIDENPIEAFKRYCVSPELRGSRNKFQDNLTYLGHVIYKNYGITDEICLTDAATDVVNIDPIKNILVDIDKSFIKNEDNYSDYDIAITFDFSIDVDVTTLYKIEDDKYMEIFLFNTYLFKNPEPLVESNCLNYLLTKEVVEYLNSQDDYVLKNCKFIKA